MATHQTSIYRTLAVLLATAVLAACASLGDSASQSRPVEPTKLGLTAPDAHAFVWPPTDWWTGFGDSQLDRLIETAQAGNPSLKLAEARVRLARQAEALAGAANGPNLALNANATRERLSENYIFPPPLGGSTVTDSRVALDFSYEFDFWGRQRDTLAAAAKQTEAAQAEAASARLVLSVAVARTYFQLQRRYEELAIAQDTLKQREAITDLVRVRISNGLSSRGEIDLPTAQVSSARQDTAAIEESIAVLKHQIAALTGQGPDATGDIAAVPLPGTKAVLPGSLPADLLGRRPDIVAQRLRVEAAAKDISAAKAEFYPNVDLTAFFGLQAIAGSRLFEIGSRTAGIGPAIHLPIFEAGRLQANLGARHAEYDIAVEQYNQTLIDAVREVADQGSSLKAVARQQMASSQTLASLQRNYDVTVARYRGGLATYLDVLTAETMLFAQRRTDAELRERELQADVGLIKALGGGYTAPTVSKPASTPKQVNG